MRWLDYLSTVMTPEVYHGRAFRTPFFEGWYFKAVDASRQHRWAVIPGVFLGEDFSRHHAFVQVLDGMTGEANYHRFAADEFVAARSEFDVRVGPNRFWADGCRLDLDNGSQRIHGELRHRGRAPWPVTWAAPGVMGWYGWLPFLECYHGIVSLDHELDGTLEFNGRAVDFAGGRGYMEKDWGRSFPSGWIWMQTNHFEKSAVSLTASVAVIPWGKRAFAGFLVGLWHEGCLHRFTTYTGAQIRRLEVTDDHVFWTIGDRHEQLEIVARRATGGSLLAPTPVEMGVRVSETLSAEVSVRLTTGSGQLVFGGTGQHAGLEVAGDVARLLTMVGGMR